SAAQVKNTFHVTLHRLRKALDYPEWIVSEGDRYRFDPSLRIDFDVARYRSDVESVLRSGIADVPTEQRLAAALALYAGDFLEGEAVGDWHLEIADRLRRLHVDALLAYGTRLMDTDRPAAAAAV